jgi:hypothetical protein
MDVTNNTRKNAMTIADLLKMEQEHRKAQKWLMFSGNVVNDHGVTVPVQIKSFGFYNQIFRIGDGIDYASSHSINKVGEMKKHITDTINRIQTPA